MVHGVCKTFKGELITQAAIVLEIDWIPYDREEVCDTSYDENSTKGNKN